ncbi:MAG: hypothetical protein HGB12_17315, partial [Bacteroidetes bacterium]|nr:hypothetical protein [Bacteroidota bacterium]
QINGVYAGSYILRLLFAVNLTGGSSGPKWMGAGNSITIKTEDASCVGTVPVNWLSVIEFDVVP